MYIKHIGTTLLAMVLAVLLLGPSSATAGQTVFVSILPQKYFTERIAGNLADVHVLVMPGVSPHTYEPTPKQMVKLSKATAYFSIGVEFEKAWLPRLSSANPDMKVFATHQEVRKIPMARHGHAEDKHHDDHDGGHDDDHDEDHKDTHDDEHGHAKEILDPHVWLSPDNARLLAQFTCRGFIAIDPANTNTYKNNLIALLNEIDEVDAAIRQSFKNLPDDKRTFMVFHPSWGYFAEEYGLTQMAIESEGNEPSPRALTKIIKHGREMGIRVIFVQPQFSQKSAQVIANELGAKVMPLDPLAEDWRQNMLHAAQAFEQSTH